MTKKNNRTGEYIHMYWDDCEPDFYAVRGHVADKQFWDELWREVGQDRSLIERVQYNGPTHRFARFEFAPWHLREMGLDKTVKIYSFKGFGCFPVTVIERKP